MKITSAAFVKSCPSADALPHDERPMVAFVGRSNAGKSSLINSMTQRKDLSRVSNTPGRTQHINLFLINDRFYFVDLPGYGYAKVGKSQRQRLHQLIHEFLVSADALRLVVVIVDARVGVTELDREMLDLLTGLKIPTVIAANKIDKLSKTEAYAALQAIEAEFHAVIIPHSAVTGEGRGLLLEQIERVIRQDA